MSVLPDLTEDPYWQPLIALQNTENVLSVSIVDPTTMQPLNLNGYTASMVVKPSRYLSDNQGTTYSASVSDSNGGTVTVTIDADDPTVISPGIFWYHVLATSGSGGISGASYGPFTVQAV